MAREMPGYKHAVATLLACEDIPQTADFQADFKNRVEAALGAEHGYEELENTLSVRARLLLENTRAAYQEGWRRVCATKHPRCVAAVTALAHSPAVPTSFRRTVERELSYALVCADAEQFEQLLLGSSSTRLPPVVRKLISDAMLAFDDEKARLDQLASEEQLKAAERAVLAKISQDAWKKAQTVRPERTSEQESEEVKESRRMAKARLRGRRKNLDHASLVAFGDAGDTLQPKQTARQLWDKVRHTVKNSPALESDMEPGPGPAVPEPEQEFARHGLRKSLSAEQVFYATLAGEERLGSLLGMHLRRAFANDEAKKKSIDEAKGKSTYQTNETTTPSQSRGTNVDACASKVDTASETGMAISKCSRRRRARPLSAGLQKAVELRTGRRVDAVTAPVDTASISAFARRQKQERDDATLTLNRLKEELELVRHQHQTQTRVIERFQSSRLARRTDMPGLLTLGRAELQPEQQVDSPAATEACGARMASTCTTSDQLPMAMQVQACEQIVASAAAGDFATVMSVLTTCPQSATVIDNSSATLLHRLLAGKLRDSLPLPVVTKLLSIHPAAAQCSDTDGQMPAHVALSNSSLRYQVVLAVLRAWPQAAQHSDATGQTPLHKAVAASWPGDILQAVLDAAPVAASLQDRTGRLPLHIACTCGASASLLAALTRANPRGLLKKDITQLTPLHILAAQDGTPLLDACRVLCSSPTAVTACKIPDFAGDRPLHIAARRSVGDDVVSCILQTDVSAAQMLNWDGLAPIHVAVTTFCKSFAQQLSTKKQSSVQIPASSALGIFLQSCPETAAVRDVDGNTALHLLLAHGAGTQVAAVHIIEDIVATYPAAVSITRPATGETALMVAVRTLSLARVIRVLARVAPQTVLQPDAEGNLPANVCVQLATAGASVKGPDVHKATLRAAARLRALVDACPDALRARSEKGETPLLTACGDKDGAPIAIIAVILELDSKSNGEPAALDATTSSYGGDSPLHLLMKAPRPKLSALRMLLDSCNRLALVKNSSGTTPLHLALKAAHVEATMMMLSSCPAAAAVPDGDGQYPLHLAIQSQAPEEVISAVLNDFPSAAIMPNKTGQSPLALGLQAWSEPNSLSGVGADTTEGPAPVVFDLVGLAFNAVLDKTLIEEERLAAKEHREQARAILWKWHAGRLPSPPNRPVSAPNVREWHIRDVSIWIKYVALLPRQDSLSDTEIRSLAAGQWPPCEIADDMADSGVDGPWLLSIRDTSDLPDTVAANARGSDLLDAIRELWGLQRANAAAAMRQEDAAAAASEVTDRSQVDNGAPLAPGALQTRSVVYESLLDTGIALVLESKKERAKHPQQQNASTDINFEEETATVKLPEQPSVFERLGNESRFTGTHRFGKRRAAKQRRDTNSRVPVHVDEPIDEEQTKVDRASIRAVRKAAEQKFAAELHAAREQMREQSVAREAVVGTGLGDALLERAIVIFLRCRQLCATDPVGPYNLACCHALLQDPIGASYWATVAWQLGMSPMDFASDEDLATIQTASFQRIIAAAAEDQGRHTALAQTGRDRGAVRRELRMFQQKALDTQPRGDGSEHHDAEQLRQLAELGVLFSVTAALPDTTVQFVDGAAKKIQAAFRGYLVRDATNRSINSGRGAIQRRPKETEN